MAGSGPSSLCLSGIDNAAKLVQLGSQPRHVAELRVLVAPMARGKGVGRRLTEEALRIAWAAGIEKVVAQMTPDQKQAIGVFRTLGFQPEALFRAHVRGRDGERHDLVMLSQNVARFSATLRAYGVREALDG